MIDPANLLDQLMADKPVRPSEDEWESFDKALKTMLDGEAQLSEIKKIYESSKDDVYNFVVTYGEHEKEDYPQDAILFRNGWKLHNCKSVRAWKDTDKILKWAKEYWPNMIITETFVQERLDEAEYERCKKQGIIAKRFLQEFEGSKVIYQKRKRHVYKTTCSCGEVVSTKQNFCSSCGKGLQDYSKTESCISCGCSAPKDIKVSKFYICKPCMSDATVGES